MNLGIMSPNPKYLMLATSVSLKTEVGFSSSVFLTAQTKDTITQLVKAYQKDILETSGKKAWWTRGITCPKDIGKHCSVIKKPSIIKGVGMGIELLEITILAIL